MPPRASYRAPTPIHRGQGNRSFGTDRQDRVIQRGQVEAYDLNGRPTGATVADGDKGDVIVSGSGAVWAFDPTVVTAFARTVLDDPDAPTARGTLGAEGAITAGTAAQYWRGDKTWQTLDKTAVGLGNVDNTSDANKPVSTAQQTALDAKLDDTQAGTFGLSWLGTATLAAAKALLVLVKGDVGLGNVDNTSDASKPVSTATQTALDLKLNSASYTAADVLTKLLTVDGSGSGIDADLLDGKNIGTSGNVVPLLDGANTHSGANVFNASVRAKVREGLSVTLDTSLTPSAHAGMLVANNAAVSRAFTITTEAANAWTAQTEIIITTFNTAGCTIVPAVGVTLTWKGTTGTRTLAAGGIAFLRRGSSADAWFIFGSGIT